MVLALCVSACSSADVHRGASARPSGAPTSAAVDHGFDVTVDGRSIHGRCEGDAVPGAPTIVLDVGMGNDLTELDPVAERLTSRSMVCSYDRAGILESDPPPSTPRPISALVEDLHGFLAAANIPPPYFLIGHSIGATNVFMFAQRYPDEVAGFVAMNGTPAHYARWSRQAGRIETRRELREYEILPLTGANPEGIDLRGTDGISDLPLPDRMPYAVMYALSCHGDDFCERIRPIELGTFEDAARIGAGGRLVEVRGADHEIWTTDLAEVMRTIDEIWAEAVQ
jgi:pimeloyl-ACP methyl ester carboxylesterase